MTNGCFILTNGFLWNQLIVQMMNWDFKYKLSLRVLDYYMKHNDGTSQVIHTQSVVSYTGLIAVGEKLDQHVVNLLEISAWMHDIGCPSSYALYGNSLPVNQQTEGRIITESWLNDTTELTQAEKKWLVDVVGSHHEFDSAKQLCFEPLFEADLIVNLIEGYYPMEKAGHLYRTLIRTESGKKLFKTVLKDPVIL